MRAWLLTWTTYGTWLPGDERGFVSRRAVAPGESEIHNMPATPYDTNLPLLRDYAASLMKGPVIRLVQEQAEVVAAQLRETAGHREWRIRAGAAMANHVHLVVFAPDPVPSEILLRDLKAYTSRKLSARYGKPESDTWWTASGSRRHLESEESVNAAIEYVLHQEYPLVVWTG